MFLTEHENWTRGIIYLMLLISVLILLPDCRKESAEWNPDVVMIVKPDSGLTTQSFDFNVDIPNLPKDQTEFYTRWDMDGDSVWDAPFSAEPLTNYRFYHKGVHHVKVEILTKDGKLLLLNRNVKIDQGYSAPHAAFTISPTVSHYMTDFILDANSTFDDEDDFSALQFKWDFNSDGIWDTISGSDPIVRHTYKGAGTYRIKLGVTDPTNRFSLATQVLSVTLVDSLIRPDFYWSPNNATVKDTIVLDGSLTHHANDSSRVFTYTWSIRNEVEYGPFTDPVFAHQFWKEGMERVTLTATDQFGLSNSVTKEFYLFKENRPPSPVIVVPTEYGNIATNFYLSAWTSMDDVTPPSKLKIRWDFESDGNWDTDWSYDKTIFHQFNEAGTYLVTLEAEDEGEERATTKTELQVSPYSNPTGYLLDKRDNKYYGTVKIGDQWWMSDNLDYRLDPKVFVPLLHTCYGENDGMCDLYGSLYYADKTISYINSGKNICPAGWRIPLKSDWDILYKKVPRTGGRDALLIGGSLGLNAQFTGSGYFYYERNDRNEITDTLWSFHGMGKSVKFLSTTVRPSAFRNQSLSVFSLQKNYDGADVWWDDPDYYYYIRCVKEE